MGDPAQSERLYRQAIALDPDNATAYISLAFRSMRLGEYAERCAYAEKALDITPNQPRALKAMAMCSYLAGDEQSYHVFYRRAVANGVDGRELSGFCIENAAGTAGSTPGEKQPPR